MAKHDCESQPQISNDDNNSESPTNSFFSPSTRCCFHLPCFRPCLPSQASEDDCRWWSKPFGALKKLREWSEIVAGPKWKTFIRRFNRNRNISGAANFQYDPLSYALNFDDGPGKTYLADEHLGYYPDFTSRFVSGNLSSKTSVDLGRAVAAAG